MGVIPEITCRRCGSTYSGLRRSCPKCGAPRMNQPTRVPPTTAAATPRTAASQRSEMNIRWQFVFAAVLLLAVILAVIVLVTSGRKTGTSSRPASNNPSQSTAAYIAADLPTPSPSPEPTPEASPTPLIESMGITFLNRTRPNKDMTLTNAGEIFDIDLDVVIYPPMDDAEVHWRSTNEKILTVNERGFVNVVGADPNRMVHAGIIAECCGYEDYITIYVPAFQAAYLTDNQYDAETYDADNLEWDTFIYATPAPAQ